LGAWNLDFITWWSILRFVVRALWLRDLNCGCSSDES
jgi:hypothetical protein